MCLTPLQFYSDPESTSPHKYRLVCHDKHILSGRAVLFQHTVQLPYRKYEIEESSEQVHIDSGSSNARLYNHEAVIN